MAPKLRDNWWLLLIAGVLIMLAVALDWWLAKLERSIDQDITRIGHEIDQAMARAGL